MGNWWNYHSFCLHLQLVLRSPSHVSFEQYLLEVGVPHNDETFVQLFQLTLYRILNQNKVAAAPNQFSLAVSPISWLAMTPAY